jgi:hypothetical protein
LSKSFGTSGILDKCHFGQMSLWTDVTLDKCHFGQMSLWTNFHSANDILSKYFSAIVIEIIKE